MAAKDPEAERLMRAIERIGDHLNKIAIILALVLASMVAIWFAIVMGRPL